MKLFKPEDFAGHGVLYDKRTHLNAAANRANELLAERGVRVYGKHVPTISDEVSKENDIPLCWHWSNKQQQVSKEHPGSHETHQALLVCIEELPKKVVGCGEHYPQAYRKPKFHAAGCEVTQEIWMCRNCGIPLKWEPA